MQENVSEDEPDIKGLKASDWNIASVTKKKPLTIKKDDNDLDSLIGELLHADSEKDFERPSASGDKSNYKT